MFFLRSTNYPALLILFPMLGQLGSAASLAGVSNMSAENLFMKVSPKTWDEANMAIAYFRSEIGHYKNEVGHYKNKVDYYKDEVSRYKNDIEECNINFKWPVLVRCLIELFYGPERNVTLNQLQQIEIKKVTKARNQYHLKWATKCMNIFNVHPRDTLVSQINKNLLKRAKHSNSTLKEEKTQFCSVIANAKIFINKHIHEAAVNFYRRNKTRVAVRIFPEVVVKNDYITLLIDSVIEKRPVVEYSDESSDSHY